MIPDENALLRRWISEGLNTQRVSATVLPEYEAETGDGFRPADGPWIVVSARGGNAHPENAWIETSMQVRVWAAPNQPDVARALYAQVFELLDGNGIDFGPDVGRVIWAENEVIGQDETDIDTGYVNVNSYFKLVIALQA
jgi:hypothetical protein